MTKDDMLQGPDRRLQEANFLLDALEDDYSNGRMSVRELEFYESLTDQIGEGRIPSEKQIFWLRDIRDRLL